MNAMTRETEACAAVYVHKLNKSVCEDYISNDLVVKFNNSPQFNQPIIRLYLSNHDDLRHFANISGQIT